MIVSPDLMPALAALPDAFCMHVTYAHKAVPVAFTASSSAVMLSALMALCSQGWLQWPRACDRDGQQQWTEQCCESSP